VARSPHDPPHDRRFQFSLILVLILVGYLLSAVPMLWARQFMPDMAQDAVAMIYEPAHWLLVRLTGEGNG
jgi:hypothetical protein